MAKSSVLFGSMRARSLAKEHSFAAKFLKILERLGVEGRVKDRAVMVKMHLGSGLGFTTVHPFLVGLIVSRIKKAGGKPFVADTLEGFNGATARGYTPEVIGCPILPIAGPTDEYFVPREINYKSVNEVQLAGLCKDADVLVDLSHVKGHNTVGFGGAIKNLALGCYTGRTRGAMHSVMQHDPYWFEDRCKDPKLHPDTCPFGAIEEDKRTGGLRIEFDSCNQCMRCVDGNPHDCIRIGQENFHSFQELMALTTREALAGFPPEDRFFISVATDITAVCDCWGITTGPILEDLGMLGSNDPVAIDKATLDMLGKFKLIEENVPQSMEIVRGEGLHPFQMMHGPYKDPYVVIRYASQLGLGSEEYEIEEVLPQEEERKLSRARFPKPAV